MAGDKEFVDKAVSVINKYYSGTGVNFTANQTEEKGFYNIVFSGSKNDDFSKGQDALYDHLTSAIFSDKTYQMKVLNNSTEVAIDSWDQEAIDIGDILSASNKSEIYSDICMLAHAIIEQISKKNSMNKDYNADHLEGSKIEGIIGEYNEEIGGYNDVNFGYGSMTKNLKLKRNNQIIKTAIIFKNYNVDSVEEEVRDEEDKK